MKKSDYFDEVKRIAEENAKKNKDTIDQSYVGKLAKQREKNRKAKAEKVIEESKKIRAKKDSDKKVVNDVHIEEKDLKGD